MYHAKCILSGQDTFWSFLAYILSDKVTFIFFELLFLLFFVFAVWKNWRYRSSPFSVTRGKTSWDYFYLAYGIVSVIMIQIISVSESLKGYKVLISILNVGLLLYLMFFNGWFRNKIVGIIQKSKKMKEGGGVDKEEIKLS